jgi:hypothetical protein
MKLKRMRWAGHVESMWEMKCVKNCAWNPVKGRDNLEDLGVDGMMVKCMSGKLISEVWAGFIWLRTGTGAGSYEQR